MFDDERLACLLTAFLQLDELLADGRDDGGDVGLVLLVRTHVALPLGWRGDLKEQKCVFKNIFLR